MHLVENFKGFERAEISLWHPLTVLIGRNGSGKSNLIEAVEVLAAIASGTPLYEISDRSRRLSLAIRGGLQSCPRFGHQSFALGFRAEGLFDRSRRWVTYRVEVQVDPEPRILNESLWFNDADKLFFETVGQDGTGASSDIRVRYNNFARGGTKPIRSASATRSVLSQYESLIKTNKKRTASVRFVESLRQHLRAAMVFDPIAERMRGYARIGDSTLRRDGANLSAVLHGLRGDSALERICARLSTIPDFPVEGFDFIETEVGDVLLTLVGGGTRHPARLLSDGTLRTLAVLTAVETAPPRSRVVIEEFDNGVHPSRVRALIDGIWEAARLKDLMVLVTTHNPATLDMLDAKQREGVFLTVRRAPDHPSELIALADVPRYAELIESASLGDLVTQDMLSRHLAPGFEEERKRAQRAWLERLAR